ncbi:MAG: RNase P subunit p30 family protein [Candidatus Nanoarchaeia archaeon]|nr:RNase P subunit p30 family protein [Candidatus Nanoarchaeia archaeon]
MTSDIVLFDGEKHSLGFDNVINANARNAVRILDCDESNIRQAVEGKKADIILVSDRNPKDSLHFRRAGFDEVICRLATKKGIAFAFSFSSILNARDRALVMGRIMHAIRLCRKHKVMMCFASFARNKWEMRAVEEMKAFARMLGMTPDEANNAVNSVEGIIESRKSVSGVRVLE